MEFDYEAQQDDELSLTVGDIIVNIRRDEGGWWEGELGGRRGLFPDNFVRVSNFKQTQIFCFSLILKTGKDPLQIAAEQTCGCGLLWVFALVSVAVSGRENPHVCLRICHNILCKVGQTKTRFKLRSHY